MALASLRHFLLALRRSILASRRPRRLQVEILPASAIREPARFPRTLLIWSCVRVRPAFSELSRFCFSSREATTQPYRRLYFGNVRSSATANLHFSPRNVSQPWAHVGFLRQLPDSPPTRVFDMPHESPIRPNFRTVHIALVAFIALFA